MMTAIKATTINDTAVNTNVIKPSHSFATPAVCPSGTRQARFSPCPVIDTAAHYQAIMLGQIPRPFASIALVATLLISAVGVTAPPTTARADDCLTAPNSPAPQGSRWYYHLDRATQRKCWYLTVDMIHKISETWKIPANLLVRPYKIERAT